MITEADENAINDEGINEVVGNAVNDKDEDEHEHEAVNEVGEKGTSQDPIGDEVADIEDLGHNKNEVEHEAGEKETSQYSTEDEVPEIEDLGHSATEVEHEAGEKETSQDSADFLVNVEIASNLDDEVEYIRVNMRADRHESSTNVSEEDEDVAEVEGKLQDHESDYIESDDPGEYGESDDDSGDQICRAYMGRGKKQVGHKYDPKCAFPLWKLGLRFEDNKLFKEAVRKYAIAKGVALRFKKSEPKRVRVCCKVGCPWSLFATMDKMYDCFVVKTYYPVHKCVRTNENTILTRYAAELLHSNPGSTISIQVHRYNDNKAIFHRMYICFDALKKGELLVAIGRDENNQMFPVA
ncbi:hypothetical protein V6N11_074125 [Hibiscus sabdariffa]|uniref:Transposase MuDR plant domain-containing protein n=1 Tax=Hibiscus sabdariffa TaxID=183260 RepID=A0ABR1ZMC8_9ROSI